MQKEPAIPPISHVRSSGPTPDPLVKNSPYLRRGDGNPLMFEDEDMAWTVEVPPALRKKLTAVCDQIHVLGEAMQRMELHVEKKASKMEISQILKKKVDFEYVEGNKIASDQRLGLMEARLSELQDLVARTLVENTRMSSQIEVLMKDRNAHEKQLEDRKHEMTNMEESLRILISRTKDELYNSFYKKTSRMDQSIENLEGRISIQESTLTPFMSKHDEQIETLADKDECIDDDIRLLTENLHKFEDDVKKGLAGIIVQTKGDIDNQAQYIRSAFGTLQTEINVARQDAARILAFQEEFQSVVDRVNTVKLDCQHNTEDMVLVRDRVRLLEGSLRENSRSLEVSVEHLNTILRDKEGSIRSWAIERLGELEIRLSETMTELLKVVLKMRYDLCSHSNIYIFPLKLNAIPHNMSSQNSASSSSANETLDLNHQQYAIMDEIRSKEIAELKKATAKLGGDISKLNEEVFVYGRKKDEKLTTRLDEIKEELSLLASQTKSNTEKTDGALFVIDRVQKEIENKPSRKKRQTEQKSISPSDSNEALLSDSSQTLSDSSSEYQTEGTKKSETGTIAGALSKIQTEVNKLNSEFQKELSSRSRSIHISQESLKALEDGLEEEIRNRRINYQEIMRIIEGIIGPENMQKAIVLSASNHPVNLQFSAMGSRPIRRPNSASSITATPPINTESDSPAINTGADLLREQSSRPEMSSSLFYPKHQPRSESTSPSFVHGKTGLATQNTTITAIIPSVSAAVQNDSYEAQKTEQHGQSGASSAHPPIALPSVNTPRKVSFSPTNTAILAPMALPDAAQQKEKPASAANTHSYPSPRKARTERDTLPAVPSASKARSTPSPAHVEPKPPTAPNPRR